MYFNCYPGYDIWSIIKDKEDDNKYTNISFLILSTYTGSIKSVTPVSLKQTVTLNKSEITSATSTTPTTYNFGMNLTKEQVYDFIGQYDEIKWCDDRCKSFIYDTLGGYIYPITHVIERLIDLKLDNTATSSKDAYGHVVQYLSSNDFYNQMVQFRVFKNLFC